MCIPGTCIVSYRIVSHDFKTRDATLLEYHEPPPRAIENGEENQQEPSSTHRSLPRLERGVQNLNAPLMSPDLALVRHHSVLQIRCLGMVAVKTLLHQTGRPILLFALAAPVMQNSTMARAAGDCAHLKLDSIAFSAEVTQLFLSAAHLFGEGFDRATVVVTRFLKTGFVVL